MMCVFEKNGKWIKTYNNEVSWLKNCLLLSSVYKIFWVLLIRLIISVRWAWSWTSRVAWITCIVKIQYSDDFSIRKAGSIVKEVILSALNASISLELETIWVGAWNTLSIWELESSIAPGTSTSIFTSLAVLGFRHTQIVLSQTIILVTALTNICLGIIWRTTFRNCVILLRITANSICESITLVAWCTETICSAPNLALWWHCSTDTISIEIIPVRTLNTSGLCLIVSSTVWVLCITIITQNTSPWAQLVTLVAWSAASVVVVPSLALIRNLSTNAVNSRIKTVWALKTSVRLFIIILAIRVWWSCVVTRICIVSFWNNTSSPVKSIPRVAWQACSRYWIVCVTGVGNLCTDSLSIKVVTSRALQAFPVRPVPPCTSRL